jgi:hypothetical protein
MLDPDDWDLLLPRLINQAADVGNDRVALVRFLNRAVLDVHDQ